MTHITLPRETVQQAVTDIICGNTEYAITALCTALEAPNPPHECKTEAEKIAFAFGWWKALEVNRAATKVEPVLADVPCSDHPDAPHGYSRNASHNAGRYVCECEGWIPEAPDAREPLTVEEIDALTYKHFGTDLVNPYAYARAIEAAHGIGTKEQKHD